VTFFIGNNITPDIGRIFSLLKEATQMTQNKKKKQTLGVKGGMKFILLSVLQTQQRFSDQPGKNLQVYFLNLFYKISSQK
jgi:hypothetical protein